MIVLYLKQAWTLLRQEKLFSAIYIIGTGLSITMVMVLAIVYYVKIANVYPESNRDRLLSVKSGYEIKKDNADGWYNSRLSLKTVDACFRSLQHAEAVTAIYEPYGAENYIQPVGSREQLPTMLRFVDTAFWKVFPFAFVAGQPFTQADFDSAIFTAVIAESMAKRLFGRVDVVGEEISVDFRPYRVCGVVKDASFATPTTYAHCWIPYTTQPNYDVHEGYAGYMGLMKVYMLANSVGVMDELRDEVLANLKRVNLAMEEYELHFSGQPDRHWQSLFRNWSMEEIDFNRVVLQYGLVFFLLLFVPAVSLSGMTDSRMERRMVEIGIRRSFGAPVGVLMRQILTENLLFTLLGGLVGLCFSYLLLPFCADWIMTVGQTFIELPAEGVSVTFTPSMLLNLPVFLIALTVCFLLNLMSALLPAWQASRYDIIYSLNEKR